jgi:hypothetical protein
MTATQWLGLILQASIFLTVLGWRAYAAGAAPYIKPVGAG